MARWQNNQIFVGTVSPPADTGVPAWWALTVGRLGENLAVSRPRALQGLTSGGGFG